MPLLRPFILFAVMLACSCGDSGTPGTLPTRQVTVEQGGTSAQLTVELATTEVQREQGLMYRQEMADDRGMLFLFTSDGQTGFWMKNTYIPLTIAYLDAGGRVLELRDGRPLDETILTPARPYRLVLEVNQGWFQRHGLGVGAVVHLPPDLPPAQ